MSFMWTRISLPESNSVEIDVLIKEARQRQRRRRRFISGFVLSALALMTVVAVAVGGNSNRAPIASSSHPRGPSSSHVSLNQSRSASVLTSVDPAYMELTITGGRLYATAPSLPQGGCVTSPVNMRTLKIETKIASPCPVDNGSANVSGYLASTVGETVTLQISCNQKMTLNSGSVQIAVLNRQTGKTADGPVVMTYSCAVNTFDLEDAYGAGYLWIYDCETPNGSQLLEVSAITGVVEERLSMPHVCKANIEANVEGFFLTESSEWFQPPKNTMYHVAPGTNNVVAIDSFTGGSIWSATSGRDFWVEAPISVGSCGQLCQADELVRYVSVNVIPQVIASNIETNAYQPGPISGGGSDWVIQTRPKGKNPTAYVQSLVQIDTSTGRIKTIGTFGNDPLVPGAGQASIVYLNGAIFALEGGQIYRLRG